VEATSAVPDASVWWSCADCGIDVELPAADTAGFVVPCPDCPGALDELWRWEPVSA
jgi:hypothetical protein